MIIRLSHGDDVVVAADRGERIKAMLLGGAQYIDLDGRLIKAASIMELAPSKSSVTENQPKLASPTTELTDEHRERNLRRIQAMRERFLKGRS